MHADPHALREAASRLSLDIDQRLVFGDTSPAEHDALASASEQAKRLLATLDRVVGVPPPLEPHPKPPAFDDFFSRGGRTPTVNEFARSEAAKRAAPEWTRGFFDAPLVPPDGAPGRLEFAVLVRTVDALARRTAALEAKVAGTVKV